MCENDFINHLRSAALFLYLSRYEGFGFPPLQAMACGTPIITSNCTSIPEVVGNVGYKYSPDDHIAIAKGIEYLLMHRQAWEEQSLLGVKRSDNFHWRVSAAEHMALYKLVLQGR